MYIATAVLGYMMFGDLAESQFTLNMPTELVASKIAVWTTVCQLHQLALKEQCAKFAVII